MLAGLAVVTLSVTTMSGAHASAEIQTNTSSSGLSTENSAAQAPMTKSPVKDPSTRSLAKSKGLKLEGLTIQSDAKGGRFLLDTEGNWFLQIPSEPASLPVKQHALDIDLPANWSATGCVGSFKPMAKQTGELHWGQLIHALQLPCRKFSRTGSRGLCELPVLEVGLCVDCIEMRMGRFRQPIIVHTEWPTFAANHAATPMRTTAS
ncbi:hypothetical protein JOE62_002061 [Glutamicibacter nicotianae]|nr:hypothetical protein [Glutamicibacter nicotianae]